MKTLQVLLALVTVVNRTLGGNILFLSAVPSPSHHIYNRAVVLGLVDKGHNVTFVSVDIAKKETPNVHYIHLERTYEMFINGSNNIIHLAKQGVVEGIVDFYAVNEIVCNGNLNSKGIDVIINYPDDFKFNAVLFDFTFGPCLLPLVHKFNNPPLISISAFANPPYTTDYIGGQKYPAYVPHYSVTYTSEMPLFERFYNTFLYFIDWALREFVVYPNMEKMTREKFKFDFPPLKEISQKTSLMLINTDDAIDVPEPLQPNMIQVGGLQITDTKPLPQEMEAFIKSGKKGTVLMSLGTNMKSNMLGEERLRNILMTFSKLPEYNFIWKFESEAEELPVTPTKNVMIFKFLPQNDVLAHPNLVAFISHAGMLSTHEAMWHGKPVIGIPLFADQHQNLKKAITLGVAIKVGFADLTVDSFKSSIEEVLKNPKYSEKALKVSQLFKDKRHKPLDTAVWWIEYAMRNPNLDNLRSPTLKLGPFVSKSYDVILMLIIVLHLVAFTICKIVNFFKKLKGGKRKLE